MDYRFYVKALGALPVRLFNQIVEQAPDLPFGSNISFKNREKFDSYRRDSPEFDNSPFEQLMVQTVSWLQNYVGVFNWEDLAAYEVNRIFPGGLLGEHTDLYGPLRSGYKVCVSHKIHVPLISQGAYHLHRRAKSLSNTKSVLTEGTAYCYNNYVWHSAHNEGTIPRLELTLLFWDHDWSHKNKIYDMHGLTGDGY